MSLAPSVVLRKAASGVDDSGQLLSAGAGSDRMYFGCTCWLPLAARYTCRQICVIFATPKPDMSGKSMRAYLKKFEKEIPMAWLISKHIPKVSRELKFKQKLFKLSWPKLQANILRRRVKISQTATRVNNKFRLIMQLRGGSISVWSTL